VNTQILREQTPWGELVLRIEDDVESVMRLMLEGTFLMDSESVASEKALAHRGLALWRGTGPLPLDAPRVLVGGLGLGLTLRALLEEVAVGLVTVVELFKPLIEWNRGPLAELNCRAMADPRVECLQGDMVDMLSTQTEWAVHFDLLLLDIDNGPSWLSREENASLYSAEGLSAVQRCLRPDGVAVFWATERCFAFESVLEEFSTDSSVRWGWEAVAAEPARGQDVPPEVLYWVSVGRQE